MPYKDPDKQREYQRQWRAKRHDDWFSKNGPCVDCGSWDDLELDHVDPSQKISHRLWSWSEERRNKELSKCVIRCRRCHIKKWRRNKEYVYGEENNSAKLTEQQVLEIRHRFVYGESQTSLAKRFGLSREAIYDIVHKRNWKHIDGFFAED